MNAPRFTDSPEQAKVVNAPTGDDVLVVAGAGSGKTYTMTRRIINLIAQGVPAERILGLTFTRKAASELLSRVSAAVLADGGDERFANRAFLKPEVSTYDAFFQTIVGNTACLSASTRTRSRSARPVPYSWRPPWSAVTWTSSSSRISGRSRPW